MGRLWHFVLLLFLLLSAAAWGQENSSQDKPKGIEYHVEVPDSVQQASVFTFNSKPNEVKMLEYRHLSHRLTGAQFCDRLDALNGNYYLTVTELGHPHLELFHDYSSRLGGAFKPSLYPGLFKTPDNVSLYQVQHPLTLLSYNSSLKRDYQLHLLHTQNINPRWNFAIDYQLIGPKGTYANTAASDHLLDVNSNYYSRDSRYQLAAGAIWQRMLIGENGGLLNESAFLRGLGGSATGVPVVSNSRGSFSSDLTLFARQSFNTVRQVEWYRPIRKQLMDTVADSVTHDTVVRLRDTVVGCDTLYPSTPKIFNTGVVRLDLQLDRHKYRYNDSLFYNHFTTTLFWTNDAYPDSRWVNPLKLQAGIRPEVEWTKLDESVYARPSTTEVSLFPYVRAQLSPWRGTELTVLAEATPTFSQYNLDGRLLFPFRDSLGRSERSVAVHAVVESDAPDLIYTVQCLRPNSPVEASNLKNIGVRKVEALYWQGGFLNAAVALNHIDNNIWFVRRTLDDGSAMLCPAQADGGALLLQGRVNMEFCFWNWLHYDMQQLLQYSSHQDRVRVPLLASKNSVYADFFLFRKVLHAQVGADLRYHTPFKADAYDPALGVFYRQDDVEVGNYLWGDLFVNLQIKKATIYVKAGHINELLETKSYCILPHYPAKPFGLSFGLTWVFYD